MAESEAPIYNYQAPGVVNANQDQNELAALVARLQQLGVSIPPAVVALTPEQEARKILDKAGAGLGHDEARAELYKVLSLIAQKVGI